MIRSVEAGEDWWWCYADLQLYEHPMGAVPDAGPAG